MSPMPDPAKLGSREDADRTHVWGREGWELAQRTQDELDTALAQQAASWRECEKCGCGWRTMDVDECPLCTVNRLRKALERIAEAEALDYPRPWWSLRAARAVWAPHGRPVLCRAQERRENTMGAECNRCGHDIYDECHYCKVRDENARLREALAEVGKAIPDEDATDDQLDTALDAIDATVQAALNPGEKP